MLTKKTSKQSPVKFSQVGGSIIVALLMIAAAFPLLFINEGRTIKRQSSLAEGASSLVTIAADLQDTSPYQGRLVHVSGTAESDAVLLDPEFEVTARAVKLLRTVEMYQWHESTNKASGDPKAKVIQNTVYERKWSSTLINSNFFQFRNRVENPDSMPFHSKEYVSQEVRLGSFTLTPSQVERLNGYRPLAIGEKIAPADAAGRPVQRLSNGLYLGGNPDSPRVGDIRILFSTVPNGPVTLISALRGRSFAPYQTESGGLVDMIRHGKVPFESMISKAQQNNSILAWVIRVAGFLLFFLGLRMLPAPMAKLRPRGFLWQRAANVGRDVIGMAMAVVLSSLTIAVGWLFYRPLVGGGLVALALLIFLLVSVRIRKA